MVIGIAIATFRYISCFSYPSVFWTAEVASCSQIHLIRSSFFLEQVGRASTHESCRRWNHKSHDDTFNFDRTFDFGRKIGVSSVSSCHNVTSSYFHLQEHFHSVDSAGFLGWSMPWILNFWHCKSENVGSPAPFFRLLLECQAWAFDKKPSNFVFFKSLKNFLNA